MGKKNVAIVERFEPESMYGLSAKKRVTIVEGWPLVQVQLYEHFVVN